MGNLQNFQPQKTNKTNPMITHRIYDTFNRRTVSNHKSLKTAVIAESKFLRAVKRANGAGSYLPTRIEYLSGCGQWIGVPNEDICDVASSIPELKP